MGINGGVSRTNDQDVKLTSDGTTEVEVTGPINDYGHLDTGQAIVCVKLDELISLQKGILRLLEVAFEDGLSSDITEDL